ncbi:cell wall surface anchor family protein, putative [Babesia caballi]|uniref:Cell wall surface anchor family protein, putative n=1 Tax=Babesia caballi TaxID=5871 RepID=A0AAV4LNS6_BABCB|nr:cell wall surface anchor family protein, putative [Babesia caballi]
MEYDVDGTQATCLFSALETCLAKCRHTLQDEVLVEHYENLYQSNLFQFNKILALLKRTLEDSKANAERVSAAIENDAEVKQGMHLEVDTLGVKCKAAEKRALQLEAERKEAEDVLKERVKREEDIAELLEWTEREAKSTEAQTTLAYYALLKVKETFGAVQGRISSTERRTNERKANTEAHRNIYRMMLAEVEDRAHFHNLEVARIARIHEELRGEKASAEEEHAALVLRVDGTRERIASLLAMKDQGEAALLVLDEEIRNHAERIAMQREELARLENEISERSEQLAAANSIKDSMRRSELEHSTRLGEIQMDVDALQSTNADLASAIDGHKPKIRELEQLLLVRAEELRLKSNQLAEHVSACNALRMKMDEVVTKFTLNSKAQLNVATGLYTSGDTSAAGKLSFRELNKLVSYPTGPSTKQQAANLRKKQTQLEACEHEATEWIKATSQELQTKINENKTLTGQLEALQKQCATLNEEIARLREEANQLTSKAGDKKQMREDLFKEQEYIQQSIEELRVMEEQRKLDYSKQIQGIGAALYSYSLSDQIEAQKARLKQLKSDDCADLAEIIDEEKRNSDILLHAAIEALELEHARERSKLDVEHNDAMHEEKEKFEAIRKVNASEIARLRAAIEERKLKSREPALATAALPAKPTTPIFRPSHPPPQMTKWEYTIRPICAAGFPNQTMTAYSSRRPQRHPRRTVSRTAGFRK